MQVMATRYAFIRGTTNKTKLDFLPIAFRSGSIKVVARTKPLFFTAATHSRGFWKRRYCALIYLTEYMEDSAFTRERRFESLAYMRLMSDRHSDVAFERVVNTPSRGIGDKTLDGVAKLRENEHLALASHKGRLK
ncbi:MAG: hypothetical protein CM1200mP9_10010 [Gammaproteobacteria bacterium]|nr:MAG: hypothetical protein CM1200mP9_10010 [Gammaproteobacteria bacterium]